VEGKLRGPVMAYIVVITGMVALAAGSRSAWIAAAATAFFVSDLSVARDRFVAPGFGNRLWGLPLYYSAQILFVLSIGR
jgi:uncharacterized membrane protein YhhN